MISYFCTLQCYNCTMVQYIHTTTRNILGSCYIINRKGYNTDKLVDVTDVLLANTEYQYMCQVPNGYCCVFEKDLCSENKE